MGVAPKVFPHPRVPYHPATISKLQYLPLPLDFPLPVPTGIESSTLFYHQGQ